MKLEASSITSLSVPGGWRWPHFKASEFASRETGRFLMDTDLLDRLETLRTKWGKPLVPTSGYRTPSENAKKSSTGLTGPHTTGLAVDLSMGSADRYEFVKLAFAMGFTGIGVAKTFIHLDMIPPGHPSIPRPMIWSY